LRIYQAAQHLGVTSKDLLDLLKEQGVDVKSPSSTVDESAFFMAERLLNAAASAPPVTTLEPARTKAAEPAPIPTKAGRVGSIPVQKGGKGKEADESSAAQPAAESLETEVEPEAPSSVPELVEEAAPELEAPTPVEEPPVDDRPTPPIRRTPTPSGPIPVAQKSLRTMG